MACGTNGQQPASGVDKHRGYAFQWYALAALIFALAGFFGWKSVAHAMKRWRRYVPLYVLLAITVVPIVAAYLSYYFAPPERAHQLRNCCCHSGQCPICR